MCMKSILLLMAMTLPAPSAMARPVLLELFTSQSCSSCPPAEALLSELKATRTDIVALEFHVDYWNALQWRDPFSARAYTNRQRSYGALLGTETFTPQLVVDGLHSAVGSDRAAVDDAIATSQRGQSAGPTLAVSRDDKRLTISIGGGTGDATVLLAGYDAAHTTTIPAGENGGAVLHEVNVVRSLQKIAHWNGQGTTLGVSPPEGERYAVILQAADGSILGTSFPEAPR